MIENTRFLAIGHSHMGAVQKAYRLREGEGGKLFSYSRFVRLNFKAFQPNFVTEKSVRKVSPDLKRRLKHIVNKETPDVLLLSMMGNEFNSIGMLKHPTQFDFSWPSHDLPSDENATQLTFDLFRAEIDYMARQNAILLAEVFAEVDVSQKYLLCPPPPIDDEEHIMKYPGAFGRQVKKFGLSSAEFRMKIWLIYVDVLEKHSKRLGFTFLDSPFDARDKGYLAKPYRNDDPTHGNPAYGELVLNLLEKKIAKEAAL